MGKHTELTTKQRVTKLKELIKDCEKIQGFNQKILKDYQDQLKGCEAEMEEEKKKRIKLRRLQR